MAWANIRKITIDHTKVVGGANLTDFVFQFNGTYDGTAGKIDLRTVANGGQVQNSSGFDIVFALDGLITSLLNWDVKLFNAATGENIIWVQVPTVFAAADTHIFIAFGNSSISSFQGGAHGAAWDSHFKAVHHFPGTGTSVSSTVFDATSNNNDMANISGGSNFLVASPLGLAMEGTGQYVYSTTPTGLPSGPEATLECWFKQSGINLDLMLASFGDNNNSGQTRMGLLVFQSGGAYIGEQGALANWSQDTTSWHHLAAVWPSGITQAGQALVYLDGVLQTIAIARTWTPAAHVGNMDVGTICGAEGIAGWQGSMVEHRISNIARSAGWIGTTYNTGISPSTFYTIGPAAPVATLVIDDGPGLTDRSDYLDFGDNKRAEVSLMVKTRGTANINLIVRVNPFTGVLDPYTPTTGAQIYLSDLNVPVCIFGGTIDTWQIDYIDNDGNRHMTLTCTDFLQTIDTIVVTPRAYFNTTAGAIVTDIYNTLLAPTIPFALGTISAGVTVPALVIDDYRTVGALFTQLANASGFMMNIDFSLSIGGAPPPVLNFQAPGAVASPITLLTDDLLFGSVIYNETRSNFINRQIVKISYNAFPSLTNFDTTPNGILTSFTLPFTPYQVTAAATTTSTQSTQTGTFTGVPSNNDTVTIAGQVYTWKTTLDNTQTFQIHIGATANASAANLADAINANPATAGVAFSLPTWMNATCSAKASSATVTVAVMQAGAAGNGTGTTESTANFTFGGTSTAGAVDGITTALTVASAGGTAQLIYTSGSTTVTTAVAPATGVALVVVYQRLGANAIAVENTASVATRSAAEGGTGKYQTSASDSSQTSLTTALQEAQGALTAYNVLPDTLQFDTDVAGWVLGQEIATSLTNPAGIATLVSGNWLIFQIDAKLEIVNDPRKAYTPFRYTVYLINVSTVATYVQFFQQLALTTNPTQGAINPNSGAGAAQSPPQFIEKTLNANDVTSLGTLNSLGVTLTVTIHQDATGGWTETFDVATFTVNPADTVNPAALSTTVWTFQGNGSLWVETSYKRL